MSKKNAASNVVSLEDHKKKKHESYLCSQEQHELVLEFRVKAKKLARSILRKWNARLDLMEVDSIVDLSLCEAVRRFDPDRGASFMTFLYYHLKGNLIRTVTAAASNNAVPVDMKELDDAEVHNRGYAYRNVNSIEVSEALALEEVETPDKTLLRKEMLGLASHACQNLDDLEKEVIFRVFLKGQQLVDVAKNLGYSRCHISRVKRKALQHLNNDMQTAMDNPHSLAQPLKVRKQITRRNRSKKEIANKEEKLAAIA